MAFPSVRPVDLLASAGVVSLAVGLAFKDVLQNLLAGVLLLFRQPFRGGDQIEVGDLTGTVDEINVRETVLTTLDGRRVLVPNAVVYTGVLRVRTAATLLRADVQVGVAYATDVHKARHVAERAARAVPGVAAEPAPELVVVGLAPSSLTVEVRVWCSPRQPSFTRVRGQVIESVVAAFRRDGIDMPTDTITLTAPAPATATLGGAAARRRTDRHGP